MATIAVVLAAGTGGAYAADLITGKDIAKNAISGKHVKRGAVSASEVRDSSLGLRDFKPGLLDQQGATGRRCVQSDGLPELVRYANTCFEKAPREPLSWEKAADACAADGRQMPSPDELWAFAKTKWFFLPMVGADDGDSRYEMTGGVYQVYSSERVWENFNPSVGGWQTELGRERRLGAHFSKEPGNFRCVVED